VLAKAQAASGLITAATAMSLIIILWLGRQFRISALLAVFLMIAAPFLTVAAVANLETVTALVGRDPTLTHRTTIWSDALEVIKESPLIGFGLEAVWGEGTETWFPHLQTTSWAAHPHNGHLDLATGLGLPAAIVATLYFLYMLFMSLNTYLNTRSSVALFCFVLLNSFFIYDLAEAVMFRFRRIEWIICVAIIVSIARRATETRNPPGFAEAARSAKENSRD
jgi:O-antigen ligase